MNPTTRRPCSTYQFRRHTKTFTGCWTCRGRKVKCDEQHPSCRQCHQKGLKCEGYNVRLHWMPPQVGTAAADDSLQPAPSKSYRSRILQGAAVPTLPFKEIDNIMCAIDSLQPDSLRHRDRDGPPSQSFQCFGILDANPTPSSSTRQSPADADKSPALARTSPHAAGKSPPSVARRHSEESVSGIVPVLSPSRPHLTSNASPQLDTLLGVDYLSSATSHAGDIVLPISPTSAPELRDDELFYNELSLAFESFQEASPMHDWDQQIQFNQACNPNNNVANLQSWEQLPFHSIPAGFAVNALTNEETFLMHHYATKVVHLFCALDNPKSPWQTIHLPRALQSAGEMVVHGSTSGIRHSLRNALLSISAFCLSNEYKIQSRQDLAKRWSRRGTYYRGKSIMHLKQVLESDSRPKYKEILATMLSMISINVMSGDTETCGVHLDGARKLILQARSWKSRYSSKALALHRIYFYLHTIFQSTSVMHKAGGHSSFSFALSQSESPGSEISGALDEEQSNPPPSLQPRSQLSLTTYTHVYGIPQSLLALLCRTIRVVNKAVEEREQVKARTLSPQLATLCDELESSIMDWNRGGIDDLAGTPTSNQSTNVIIIRHTTQAFYNAIIVYFVQHIRLLRYHYIQPFIVKVLDSIEAIEQIKKENGILATPLHWPAFIAASEAFDPDLQKRFKDWYMQVELYGVESVRTGIHVLLDVWKQGPCPGQTLTSIWRQVVQRTGATLILS